MNSCARHHSTFCSKFSAKWSRRSRKGVHRRRRDLLLSGFRMHVHHLHISLPVYSLSQHNLVTDTAEGADSLLEALRPFQ